MSAFNTVVTTDLVQPYLRKDQPDEWYVSFGRVATIGGIFVSIFTAMIASTYDNLMNYLQALFSIFNVLLFATFIIGMFWKRMTLPRGFWGLIAGTVTAAGLFIGYKAGWIGFGSDLDQSMWGAGAAFVVDAVVTVLVTLADPAQADRRAARLGLRHGERGRSCGDRLPLVAVAEAARVLRARGCRHPDDRVLVSVR